MLIMCGSGGARMIILASRGPEMKANVRWWLRSVADAICSSVVLCKELLDAPNTVKISLLIHFAHRNASLNNFLEAVVMV